MKFQNVYFRKQLYSTNPLKCHIEYPLELLLLLSMIDSRAHCITVHSQGKALYVIMELKQLQNDVFLVYYTERVVDATK